METCWWYESSPLGVTDRGCHLAVGGHGTERLCSPQRLLSLVEGIRSRG
jgi:hypothetical protein